MRLLVQHSRRRTLASPMATCSPKARPAAAGGAPPRLVVQPATELQMQHAERLAVDAERYAEVLVSKGGRKRVSGRSRRRVDAPRAYALLVQHPTARLEAKGS